jgi:four helix bundle protein
MKDFRDLLVWRKAHLLTLAIYVATAKFPGDERFGLTVQMRRSSVLIAARLAEGCGKRGNGEFYRYLNIATASASELEYCILLARDLKFLDEETYASLDEKIVEVRKMLGALICKVGEDSKLSA